MFRNVGKIRLQIVIFKEIVMFNHESITINIQAWLRSVIILYVPCLRQNKTQEIYSMFVRADTFVIMNKWRFRFWKFGHWIITVYAHIYVTLNVVNVTFI